MTNMQRSRGLARWEYAIFNAVMFIIPASVLIVLAAVLGGYGDTNAGVRTLAHLAVITANLVDVAVVSLAIWVALRHCPPVMNLWRICAATVFLAYALGSTYDVIARELIGHPLPTLEQLAPGIMASLPMIGPSAVIVVLAWGVLAGLDAWRAMHRDVPRQRPTLPPSAQ